MKILFRNSQYTLNKGVYYAPKDRISITLSDEEGYPYMTASVNLPEAKCPKDHTFIKDWSENKGILDALIKQGVVEDTGVVVPTGYVEANLVKVLI